jgi:hypothetical protein
VGVFLGCALLIFQLIVFKAFKIPNDDSSSAGKEYFAVCKNWLNN